LHVFIGKAQEIIGGFGWILAYGKTDAAVDGKGKISVDGELMQFLLNTFGNNASIRGCSFDQEDCKFVAAISSDEIRAAR